MGEMELKSSLRVKESCCETMHCWTNRPLVHRQLAQLGIKTARNASPNPGNDKIQNHDHQENMEAPRHPTMSEIPDGDSLS